MGQKAYVQVLGIYPDGTKTYLTRSARNSFASSSPTVASVTAEGIVTAGASGSATITVTYRGITSTIPVTVAPALRIAPQQTTLYSSETQQFTAQPSRLSNPVIAWSTDPPNLGSISSTGLYTAPASISAPQTVTVIARNAADPTQTATAAVLLYPPASVSIQPAAATLSAGQTQRFVALLTNVENPGVNWTVSPAEMGSVDTSGLYTAPRSIPSRRKVTITATAWADSTKSASATVTLTPTVPTRQNQ